MAHLLGVAVDMVNVAFIFCVQYIEHFQLSFVIKIAN